MEYNKLNIMYNMISCQLEYNAGYPYNIAGYNTIFVGIQYSWIQYHTCWNTILLVTIPCLIEYNIVGYNTLRVTIFAGMKTGYNQYNAS